MIEYIVYGVLFVAFAIFGGWATGYLFEGLKDFKERQRNIDEIIKEKKHYKKLFQSLSKRLTESMGEAEYYKSECERLEREIKNEKSKNT